MEKETPFFILISVVAILFFIGLSPFLLFAQGPSEPKRVPSEREMAFHALKLGDDLFHKRMFSEAIVQFRLAVKLQPEEGIFHQRLGDSLLKKGVVREALKEFEEANRLKPLFPPTYLGRGMAYSRMFETEKAISILKEGIALDPNFAPLHFELAMAYVREDRLEEAIQAIESGLKIDPRAKPFEEIKRQLRQELEAERDFVTLRGEHFTIKYHPEQDKAFVESVLKDLEESYTRLSKELKVKSIPKIIVKIYPDLRWFQQAASTPEWFKGGVAKSKENKILLATPKRPKNIERLHIVLSHELTHIFMDLITHGNRPGWLNEGMAIWMSGDEKDVKPLAEAIRKGEFIPLKRLEEPFLRNIKNPEEMRLAYIESYLTVQILSEKNGKGSLIKFLESLSEGDDFEEALKRNFNKDYASLEEDLKKYIMSK